MVFEGRIADPDEVSNACDSNVPTLAKLKPVIKDRDSFLSECCVTENNRNRDDIIHFLCAKPVQGYWYSSVAGGDYLEREFHERDTGRVYLRIVNQVVTIPGPSLDAKLLRLLRLLRVVRHKEDPPQQQRIYFDTSKPYFNPLLATDENGTVIAVWLNTSLTKSGGELQTSRIKDPISGRWNTAVEETDVDGLPYAPVPAHSPATSVLVFLALLAPAAFILGLYFWSKRRADHWNE
jgi:hypothetical protein